MTTDQSDLLFRALGDPTRRGLFERIVRDGEVTVHALTEGSGVSQPMVSRHLAVLKEAGLVRAGWMERYASFWSERIDRLEGLLSRMDN
jgi:DNA-binding transcriptional ArsR family regulator